MSDIPFPPKGFFRIAETEMMHGKATAYFNRVEGKLLFVVNGQVLARLEPKELEVFANLFKDVMEMKGRYGTI